MGALTLDPASEELKEHLTRLEGGITDELFLKEFGSFLFDALFQGAVRDLFYKSLGRATAVPERGLRIKLDLKPPGVAFLPWEFLYDKGEEYFLATFPFSPLTRYISLDEPIRQLETRLPIRVLVVIPAASGLSTEKEKEILQEAFSELRSGVRFNVLEGKVTPTVLSDALMRDHYHIVHFIGHGAFVGEDAYLFFNNEEGQGEALSASRVAQFFLGYFSLKLVVLNVCQGAAISATVPMVGLAPQLVRRGVPAVVAMRYPVPDNTAILFAREFYRKLCIGPDRGRVDTAICHARNRVWMEYPGTRHVGTPVLFLRSPEGIIFDVQAEPQESHALRALDATYRNNLAILEGQLGEGADSAEVHAEVVAAKEGMKRARRIVRRRNMAVLGVALVLFFASWVGLFNLLWLDERLEQMLVHLGNRLSPPPWDEALVVVAVDSESKDSLNLAKPADLRRYHAQILPQLAKAGARVIALDYSYKTESEYDDMMAQAVRNAREHGSEVIVGAETFEIENSKVIPSLIPKLRDAVTDWGLGVVGSVLGHVRKMWLLELREHMRVPFFGLQVIYYGSRAKHLELNKGETVLTLYNRRQKEIPILQTTGLETGRPLPPPSSRQPERADRRAEIYIRFSPLETLRQHTLSYRRLVEEPEDSLFWQNFGDKLVLIGNTLPGKGRPWEDERLVYRGEKRSGVYILADGINTILQDQYVRPVKTDRHIIILLLLGGIAAFLRFHISPRRNMGGWAILLALALLYLIGALLLYTHFLRLPDIAYHLVTLFLTYWLVGLLRTRLA